MLSIRPELIRIAPAGGRSVELGSIARPAGAASASVNRLTGTIVEGTFFGQSSEHLVAVGSGLLTVVSAPPQFGIAGAVALEIVPADVVLLSR